MKFSKMRRSRFHRGLWLSFAAKGGMAALREDKWWRRMRNVNGIAWNYKEHSYWFEFRRVFKYNGRHVRQLEGLKK